MTTKTTESVAAYARRVRHFPSPDGPDRVPGVYLFGVDPYPAPPVGLPAGFGPPIQLCPDSDACPEISINGQTGQVAIRDTADPDVWVILADRVAARTLGRALAEL